MTLITQRPPRFPGHRPAVDVPFFGNQTWIDSIWRVHLAHQSKRDGSSDGTRPTHTLARDDGTLARRRMTLVKDESRTNKAVCARPVSSGSTARTSSRPNVLLDHLQDGQGNTQPSRTSCLPGNRLNCKAVVVRNRIRDQIEFFSVHA